MKRVMLALAGAVVAAAAAGLALADTVVTTSRQTFTGEITQETPENVVIKTDSGLVTIPRGTIATMEKGSAAAPATIVPAKVKPAEARKALDDAKASIVKGEWVKAGGLLEGVLALPATAVPTEDRAQAAAALVNCYLQVKDPKGAARTFARRADLVAGESDKKRLLAAAEALEKAAGAFIGAKPVATYEEAIAAAMEWKAARILDECKELGAKATDLNDIAKMTAAGTRILDRLEEADAFTPGYSAARRKDAVMALVENVFQAATRAIESCMAERSILSRYWRTSAADVKNASAWNERASRYLAIREAAASGLKNLRAYLPTVGLPDVVKTERAKDFADLMQKLDDLQYHEQLPTMPEKLRIELRRFLS